MPNNEKAQYCEGDTTMPLDHGDTYVCDGPQCQSREFAPNDPSDDPKGQNFPPPGWMALTTDQRREYVFCCWQCLERWHANATHP